MLLISELIHCLSVASAWHTATSAASHLLEMPPGHHISPCCQSSLIYLQCPQASKHLPSLLLLPSPIHFECPQPSIHLLLLLQPPIHLQCPQPNLLLLPKPPIHIYAPQPDTHDPFLLLDPPIHLLCPQPDTHLFPLPQLLTYKSFSPTCIHPFSCFVLLVPNTPNVLQLLQLLFYLSTPQPINHLVLLPQPRPV